MTDMESMVRMLDDAADLVRRRLGEADTTLVLGSGLGGFAQELEDARCMDTTEIPGYPVSTVPGHAGKWWHGRLEGRNVYLLQGRVHAYEQDDLKKVTMYVRIMKRLGVRNLILTNAAGCVNTQWKPGDLMVMSDFINFAGRSPLTGPNLDMDGPRFPDMSSALSPELRKLCLGEAEKLGLKVREGVYMWFLGPSYETPAEIRMARNMGADAVGMSTVPEILVAVHCGMRVLAVSCLTNMAAGILDQPLNHEEVMETADRVKRDFSGLIRHTVRNMD